MRIKGSVQQLLDILDAQVAYPASASRIAKRVPSAIAEVREAILHHTFDALTEINPGLDYASVYYTDDPSVLIVRFGRFESKQYVGESVAS